VRSKLGQELVVLQVIARLNLGGTAKYLITLNDGLNKAGIKSVVATGYVQTGEIEDPDLNKLKPIRVKNLGRKISLINDLKAVREVRKVVIKVNPDVIHTHTFKAGLLVRVQRNRIEASLGKKLKFVHTFHGHLFDDPEFKGFKGFKAMVIKALERRLSKRSDQLITVGEIVKSDLDSKGIYGKYKTISIPPAVTPLKLLSKNSALKKYRIKDKNRVRVLWLARVTGVKNPQRVIEIAKRLPEIDFYLAGGGDLLEIMKKQAPINLKVLGWQDAKSILPIADIFLSTSENEGMPIALIEAQLAAIPVVATNVGSVPEVILHNKSGLICSKSNDELVSAIKKLAQSKSLRAKFGKAGRVHALKSFSEKNLISAHKKLYLKLK
jgi:glycosyltransferase involved in cell wall biosynthesis